MKTFARQAPTKWDPFKVPVIEQIALWIASSLVCDFGCMNVWVTYGILTWWPLAIWIFFRRQRSLTEFDRIYFRYGFPTIALAYLAFGDRIQTLVEAGMSR